MKYASPISALLVSAASAFAPAVNAATQIVYVDREVPSQNLGADKKNETYSINYSIYRSAEGSLPFTGFEDRERASFNKVNGNPIVGIKACQQLTMRFIDAVMFTHGKDLLEKGYRAQRFDAVHVSAMCMPTRNSYEVADWGIHQRAGVADNTSFIFKPFTSKVIPMYQPYRGYPKAMTTTELIQRHPNLGIPSEMSQKVIKNLTLSPE